MRALAVILAMGLASCEPSPLAAAHLVRVCRGSPNLYRGTDGLLYAGTVPVERGAPISAVCPS